MALSQLQCLDDNHVNPRTHESKVEFLYCEDQRLALEAFLRDGREALVKLQQERGLRGFLSEPEMEALAAAVEPYDPGSELYPGDAEDDEPPLSLHYWPELSDTSVPQMDLGWPDSDSYRGVTRATVYAQPPLEGQTHIKEVVRKMIAQAQKVIAVVMDVFTDVDIFRDLLDAGFKKRVSVYILLERTSLPHFLSMCQRANMHAGHLKHLRVRCSEGSEFCTRSSYRVKGQLGHRFMFVDGAKAVSGSYSFTWMSSRLDRNLITVVTGQAVDAFDQLFRFLYANSSYVDLRQVATEPAPEQEPLQQPAPVAPPSAADLRKMYNPKYAVLMAGSPNMTPSSGPKEPQKSENSKDPEVPGSKKRRQRKSSKDAPQEAPPLHPGLSNLENLEKACLISYLPTWPEPDPPSDVIGFINIRDASKPTQVHLQRSERFETSQAIRFSSPFSMPKEILPEVAQPRQLTPNQETDKHQTTTQTKANAEESVVDVNQATQLSAEPDDIKTKEKSSTTGQKSEPVKDTNQALDAEGELHSNTPTNQDTGHNTTPQLSAHTPSQSSSNTSTPNTGKSSHSAQTLTTSSPEPQSLPGSNAEKEAEPCLNPQSATVHRTHTPESSESEQHTQTKTEVSQADSHTQTHNVQNPTLHSHIPTSSAPPLHPPPVTSTSSASPLHPPPVTSTPLSEKKHMPSTTSTSVPSTSCSSSVPPPLSSSTTLHPPLPPSSASPPSTLIAPIPKPRTVRLIVKRSSTSEVQKLPEEIPASTGPGSESDAANVAQMPPAEKEPESVQQLQNSGSKTGAQEEAENTGNPEEALQQKQNASSQETKDDGTVGPHDDRAATQSSTETKPQAQSEGLTADTPKAQCMNVQEITPQEVEQESLTPSESEILPKKESGCVATEQTDTKAPEKTFTGSESAEVPNEKGEDVIQSRTYLARAHEPQRILYCEVNAPDSATMNAHVPKDSLQGVTSAQLTHMKPKHNTHISINTQESQQTPKASAGSHTPERPQLSDTHVTDRHSLTAERQLQPIISPVRTPTPDGFLPRTPTPDSQMLTPEPRAFTPDFRTPTPDGYFSPRDSNLSTTSDEYYECSSSPLNDPVFDRVGHNNYGTTVDHDSFMHTNPPNTAACTTASPVYMNNTTWVENEADNEKEKDVKMMKLKDVTERRGHDEAMARERGLVDGGGTLGELANNTTKGQFTNRARPDEEQVEDEAALRPSDVQRTDRPQSPRETERQKTVHSS
ncbi:protein FAM83G-like isoform X2 [Paralichthys olivaceus]|uniref:protein FAM83G-like isoform X2 n=1 Tax=Paralichthys olivaceus TaxID=8255 RepID=UPI003751D70E